jgi:hypothetical protein
VAYFHSTKVQIWIFLTYNEPNTAQTLIAKAAIHILDPPLLLNIELLDCLLLKSFQEMNTLRSQNMYCQLGNITVLRPVRGSMNHDEQPVAHTSDFACFWVASMSLRSASGVTSIISVSEEAKVNAGLVAPIARRIGLMSRNVKCTWHSVV